ncbi:peptide/nickel transport system ATP-binding protein [Rhodococcus sp. 27YEA15]|uniref:ABC transporter ATP-binding protein n=1 Tax=Rhodococcus sp. 27YEA15 TaxID=3156259 RepID=UPI003C7B3543
MAGSGTAHLRDGATAVLRAEHLVAEFPVRRRQVVHAVSDVSFDVLEGETVGLVGESGCGKSSTGRAILQIPSPTSGSVKLDGTELTTLNAKDLRGIRPRMQMIFQDAMSSLNPRLTVRQIVAEGLDIQGTLDVAASAETVDRMLSAVGLNPEIFGERTPRRLSGGQAQRVCIARALVLGPRLIVCDEPVAALDVSVQAQIVNLLEDMKDTFALSMVFIAHDLAVVRSVSDRMIVMYLGKICEVGPSDEICANPAHPYTKLLLSAVPGAGAADLPAETDGELPSPLNPPSGCRFRTRCPLADDRCAAEEPTIRELTAGQYVACHHAGGSSAAVGVR